MNHSPIYQRYEHEHEHAHQHGYAVTENHSHMHEHYHADDYSTHHHEIEDKEQIDSEEQA